MKINSLLLVTALCSTAAPASVVVLGNYRTGEVVIEGNAPGGAEADRAVALAKGGSDAGWTQIYGPDDDTRGWGTVLCVRHKDGFFFAEAIGESSEDEANRTVNLKADRFLAGLVDGDAAAQIEKSATWPELARQAAARGLGEKIKCASPWNNQGQQISYSGKPLNVTDTPAEKVAAASAAQPERSAEAAVSLGQQAAQQQTGATTPRRDYEAEYQAKLRVFEEQQAEHRRKVEEYEEAQRQVEARKTLQRQQAQTVLSDYQRQLAEHAAAVAASAEEYKRWQIATQQQAPEAPTSSGSGTSIADAFKVQTDSEWARVSKGLPEPRDFPGHPYAYCYQPSLVDSSLYETYVFDTDKGKTQLELQLADEVAKKTRVSSAMSTHCYVTNDATFLDRLRSNVHDVHADMKLVEPPILLPR